MRGAPAYLTDGTVLVLKGEWQSELRESCRGRYYHMGITVVFF